MARFESFCIQNMAYKNHLYDCPFPTLHNNTSMFLASPPLEESYGESIERGIITL